jgi:nitronate monooxygenase
VTGTVKGRTEVQRSVDVNHRLHTPVCDILGCQYPIVLAGMGGVARSELVAAVTRAGGFGFLGMVREPPTLIENEARSVREIVGHGSFGVNLIPAATAPDLLDAQIATCIALTIPVIALFWNIPPTIVRRLKDNFSFQHRLPIAFHDRRFRCHGALRGKGVSRLQSIVSRSVFAPHCHGR